jgi:hypothetical protein
VDKHQATMNAQTDAGCFGQKINFMVFLRAADQLHWHGGKECIPHRILETSRNVQQRVPVCAPVAACLAMNH